MEIRDCFRGGVGQHLNIIVSDPTQVPEKLLIVTATTLREGKFHDPSCVLNAGDHPFIIHKSYIAFQYAKTRPDKELDRLLASGSIILEEKISEEILRRIHIGAATSDHIALGFRDLLRDQGFIE